jgi:hypothetical protein
VFRIATVGGAYNICSKHVSSLCRPTTVLVRQPSPPLCAQRPEDEAKSEQSMSVAASTADELSKHILDPKLHKQLRDLSAKFLRLILGFVEPTSCGPFAIKGLVNRGCKEPHKPVMLELIEVMTDKNEAASLGHASNLLVVAQWLSGKNVQCGRRAREIKFPVDWEGAAGLFHATPSNGNVSVLDSTNGLTMLLEGVYNAESPVTPSISITSNFSHLQATITIDDSDYDRDNILELFRVRDIFPLKEEKTELDVAAIVSAEVAADLASDGSSIPSAAVALGQASATALAADPKKVRKNQKAASLASRVVPTPKALASRPKRKAGLISADGNADAHADTEGVVNSSDFADGIAAELDSGVADTKVKLEPVALESLDGEPSSSTSSSTAVLPKPSSGTSKEKPKTLQAFFVPVVDKVEVSERGFKPTRKL